MTSSANRLELCSWVAIAVAMTALFYVNLPGVAVALGAAIALAWLNPRLDVNRQFTAIVIALASWPVFFFLRTNVLNQDGNMLTPKFERDVPLLGAHLTHDELVELFLHSRIWHYTNQWWGWSVVYSYQVVSCAAGALFVYGLVRLAPRLAPERTWLFLLGAVSGGYMQLFFGDVENYTIAASLVVLYVLAACRFLSREVPLWVPALVLGVATCMHLEVGWLLPSALYLAMVSRSRTGDLRETVRGGIVGAAVISSIFVFFQFYGLPLRSFFSSHAGNAFRANGVFALGMPAQYYLDQLNLLLLLCPAVALLLPFAIWRRRPSDEIMSFLVVSALSMLMLQVFWKAALGVFDDWNLYAIGGMLTSLVVWRYAAAASATSSMRMSAAAIAAIGWLYSYGWIIANHRAVR